MDFIWSDLSEAHLFCGNNYDLNSAEYRVFFTILRF